MSDRWKPSVTVAGIIEQRGQFLLVEEETPEGVMLNNPAGHLELGESPEQACIREVLEETAFAFAPQYLVGVYLSRFQRIISPNSLEDITYMRFAFCGNLGLHNPTLKLDTGIIRTVWLSIDEIRNSRSIHRSPLLLRCAEDYLRGQRYPMSTLFTDNSIYSPALK